MLIIVIIGQGHWRRHILLLCGFPGFSSVQPPAFDPSSKTKLFYCLSATSQAQKPVFGLSFSFLSQSLVDCAFIFPRPYRPWRHIAVFTTIIDRLIRICCSSCLFVQLRRYWGSIFMHKYLSHRDQLQLAFDRLADTVPLTRRESWLGSGN